MPCYKMNISFLPLYYKIQQDTRYFISGKLPIVHDYIQGVTYDLFQTR